MRKEAAELIESARSFGLAKEPTSIQVQRLAELFALNLALALGGTVRVELPGNIIIKRDDALPTDKVARNRQQGHA